MNQHKNRYSFSAVNLIPPATLYSLPVPFHQKVFHLAPLTMSVGFIGLGQMVPNNPNTFVFAMFFSLQSWSKRNAHPNHIFSRIFCDAANQGGRMLANLAKKGHKVCCGGEPFKECAGRLAASHLLTATCASFDPTGRCLRPQSREPRRRSCRGRLGRRFRRRSCFGLRDGYYDASVDPPRRGRFVRWSVVLPNARYDVVSQCGGLKIKVFACCRHAGCQQRAPRHAS